MSAEKIIRDIKQNTAITSNPEVNKEKITGVVDINHLFARVRKRKQQENKINLVFFGMFAALILIVVILLSF